MVAMARFRRLGLQRRIMLYVTLGLATMFAVLALVGLDAIDQATDLGHIHLQVSDLGKAAAFYHHLLGFDIMMSLPTALFMAAGGYHHHLGVNTWHSLHAPPRDQEALGLRAFAFQIPDEANWLALAKRVQEAVRGLEKVERDGRLGIGLKDEDGIGVEVLTPASEKVQNALAALAAA